MMRFPVPQFINVEDKVAGPLTWKQLYWMIAMTIFILLLWRALSFFSFILSAPLVIGLFGALAFYKPWGQPLLKVFWYALVFVFRPKMYTWQRFSQSEKILASPEEKIQKKISPNKEKTTNAIHNYASLLDNPELFTPQKPLTSKKKRGILNLFSKK